MSIKDFRVTRKGNGEEWEARMSIRLRSDGSAAPDCGNAPLRKKRGHPYLEEEYSLNVLSEELGPCKDTIAKWVQCSTI